MTQKVDLSKPLGELTDTGAVATRSMLEELCKRAGWPRDVALRVDQVRSLRRSYASSEFRPLDSDTFQLPFLRLHIIREEKP